MFINIYFYLFHNSKCLLFLLICVYTFSFISNNNQIMGLRSFTKQDIHNLREEVREMFQHAYDGYLKYASEYDELRPLSCDGVDTWGSYSLTLIDALDTLAVMGNYTEFQRVVDLLVNNSNFDSDINVSVFETNIRIVGGLLSAHLLSHKAGIQLEPGWPCNGPLLRLAEDVAKRLLPAFDSYTGMPYGTVNLKTGVPPGETSVTCTAGVGTFIIEFGTLSRLTGDPIYEEIALNAIHTLYNYKSPIGLYGNHIDVRTGRWTAQDSGIGAGIDSYYEYLVKGAILLNRPELLEMFNEGRIAIDKYLKRDDWHVWVSMNKGTVTIPVFQSLESYWPGVLSLIGETIPAMKTIHNYHSVVKQYGFLPEFYNIPNAEAGANRENYPLRPELIESAMYLYRATGDPYLLEIGEDMLRSMQHSAKTACGYATIKNVRDHRKEDRMESFFLAETTKYLYLLFDPDNFLNNNGHTGTIINTPNGECIIDAGGYIFNTEAHPIDPSALRCCYDIPRESLLFDYDTNKFLGDEFKIGQMKNYENFNNVKIEHYGELNNMTSAVKSDDQEQQPSMQHQEQQQNISEKQSPPPPPPLPLNHQNSNSKIEERQKRIVKEMLNTLKDTPITFKELENKLHQQQDRLTEHQLKEKLFGGDEDDDDDDDRIIVPADKITSDETGSSSSSSTPSLTESNFANAETKMKINESPVEIIKLSPTRDLDENNKSITTTTTTTTTESTINNSIIPENVTGTGTIENIPINNINNNNDNNNSNFIEKTNNNNYKNQMNNTPNNVSNPLLFKPIFDKDDINNTINNSSMLSELVQSLLKSSLPSKTKFDSQQLLEKIRLNGKYRNVTQNYELLTCKAQPYLQRLTILGEFF